MPCMLQSMELQRVRHDQATEQQQGSQVVYPLVLMSLCLSWFCCCFFLISNCSALWNTEKVMDAGVLHAYEEWGGGQLLSPGVPQGPAQHQFLVCIK